VFGVEPSIDNGSGLSMIVKLVSAREYESERPRIRFVAWFFAWQRDA
jgi:hypothetical protein